MKVLIDDLNSLYSDKVVEEIKAYENPLYEKLYLSTLLSGIVMVSWQPNYVVSFGTKEERSVHYSATFIHQFKNKNEKVLSGEVDYMDTLLECSV